MISLEGKGWSRWVFALFGIWLIGSQTPVWANTYDFEGEAIGQTPFDLKPEFREFLEEVEQVKPVDSRMTMDEIFFRARRIAYTEDRRIDVWQTPKLTQTRNAGDCEDKALWLYRTLRENGYGPVRLVIGLFREVDPRYHVWVTYLGENKQVYILDPTQYSRIWAVDRVDTAYFRPMYSFDGLKSYRHKAIAESGEFFAKNPFFLRNYSKQS